MFKLLGHVQNKSINLMSIDHNDLFTWKLKNCVSFFLPWFEDITCLRAHAEIHHGLP